jgi:hypothetical protein
MHKNKKLKHGGPIFSREHFQRMRIDEKKKLMLNYFVEKLVFHEKYFTK